jgi:RNA polymerase sigma factor (sigma-70 family)
MFRLLGCNRRACGRAGRPPWCILVRDEPECPAIANMSSPLPVMPFDGMPNNTGSTVRVPGSIEPTDAQLVAGSCAGDATAFEALVRRHYRAAFSVALAHTGHHADAEDVCHDAFVRAAERLEDCRQPDRFAQWLCAIVRNRAHNAVAHAHVRRASPLEPDTVPSLENPARDAELSDLRGKLLLALGTLPSVQREVVLLHDLHGWSHDEIAVAIGSSSGMSRQHLFKARKRLRGVLGERSSEDLLP